MSTKHTDEDTAILARMPVFAALALIDADSIDFRAMLAEMHGRYGWHTGETRKERNARILRGSLCDCDDPAVPLGHGHFAGCAGFSRAKALGNLNTEI